MELTSLDNQKVRIQDLFTTDGLKIIAIIAMTFDHVAMLFIPYDTLVGQLFRIIGRLTIGIMCFMIAEGYYHTHDRKRYLGRLFCFAIISHIPYVFLSTGKISLVYDGKFQTSVMWTLFLGLLALCVWKSNKIKIILKIVIITAIFFLSSFGDWSIVGVLFILGFGIFHDNRKKQMIFYIIISLLMAVSIAVVFGVGGKFPWYREFFHFGLLLTVPILLQYNGKQKQTKSRNLKWLFYIYYPLHMIIIRMIDIVM